MFEREELTILPADKELKKPIGWFFKEVMGIAVVNTWPLLPWYKKIFRKRFWRDSFFNILYRTKILKKPKCVPIEIG